jgi:O-antigen ligase
MRSTLWAAFPAPLSRPLLAGTVAGGVALVLVKGGVLAGLILAGLPFGFAVIALLFHKPVWGLYIALFLSFTANGLSRYVPGPLGLAIDVFLVLALLALFFQRFYTRTWHFTSRNPLLILWFVWSLYCLFEIINPEAPSKEAWFYAMRGVALYPLLGVWLAMELMNTPAHLYRFMNHWLLYSSVAALYGVNQLYIGLTTAEKAWLAAGNASTHILHGHLRVFSFYSDAGQFGAAMAHAGLVSLLIALGQKGYSKVVFLLVSGLLLYGMAISGTRGAFFVPLVGTVAYLLLLRNIKLVVVGGLIAFGLVGILKFTYIGQSNYQIQRMRSALDPEDPSLLVRIENQRRLSQYLASRPFGGGIGTAGYWGLRFSPNTFLAQTPTDSWYVKIWAETGIVGLSLYLLLIGFVILYYFRKLWVRPTDALTPYLLGMYAGVVGIMVASYGNQVLGQMPTGLVMYFSMALLHVHTHNKSSQTNELNVPKKEG